MSEFVDERCPATLGVGRFRGVLVDVAVSAQHFEVLGIVGAARLYRHAVMDFEPAGSAAPLATPRRPVLRLPPGPLPLGRPVTSAHSDRTTPRLSRCLAGVRP